MIDSGTRTLPFNDDNRPYKGAESYQAEDARLFYGRDEEAKQVVALILSRRFTLLHAPSGAGKTSLINARIVPGLERHGWNPVRILPQEDPVASVRATVLQHVLPPLELERRALKRTLEELAAPGADPTLDELLARYDDLPEHDARKRGLIRPMALGESPDPAIYPPGCYLLPFFCRLLRSSVELKAYSNHIHLFVGQVGASEEETDGVDGRTGARTLLARLSDGASDRVDPALGEVFDELLSVLNIPVSHLRPFFENLVETYGAGRAKFGLVLILDQFEELFTRFVDTGPGRTEESDLPSFRLRDELFEELEDVYAGAADEVASEEEYRVRLPVRFVVSMRDEYIGELRRSLREYEFVENLDASSFPLGWLTVEEAEAAVREPAQTFRYDYDEETYTKIMDGLAQEKSYDAGGRLVDGFVQPSHLQVVCEKLWDVAGRKLSTEAVAGEAVGTGDSPGSKISETVLENWDGVRGILHNFFHEFMAERFERESERLEALELLETLITAGGTRNIVDRRELVHQPFRDPEPRERLLGVLEEGRVVRTEVRLRGQFVEITHEFLIDSILEFIRRDLIRNPVYSAFREGVDELEAARSTNFRVGTEHVLSERSFEALDRHVDRVTWEDWAVELMYRSALVHGTPEATVERWARRYREAGESADPRAILDEIRTWATTDRTLSLEELWTLNDHRDGLPELSLSQVLCIYQSMLCEADRSEWGDVGFWAERAHQSYHPDYRSEGAEVVSS